VSESASESVSEPVSEPVVEDATTAPIERAGALLAAGGMVAFPTETVYGLGARIDRPDALSRIFSAKGRPTADPLIVHVAEVADARALAADWPEAADRLAERWWPGPLTVVVPRRPDLDDLVCAGGDTVGIRLPAHPVARSLVRAAGAPVAAPSANRFGRISPTTAAHVVAEFAGAADGPDLVLDGGPCPLGVESTVIDLTVSVPLVLRPGGLPVEDLRSVLGHVEVVDRVVADDAVHRSPGEYLTHYAPRTPLVLLDAPPGTAKRLVAALGGRGVDAATVVPGPGPVPVEQVAAGLYGWLRAGDEGPAVGLVAELVEPAGLGRAVNDRLFRAARGRLLGVSGADAGELERLADTVERTVLGVGGP
jgi:L-threonylcarbamoyladenylate synthase